MRDIELRFDLAHGYAVPEFDPDVADVVTISRLVKSDSHTSEIDVRGLLGTQGETLRDDRRAVGDVRRFVFIVNGDYDFGGHVRQLLTSQDCVSYRCNKGEQRVTDLSECHNDDGMNDQRAFSAFRILDFQATRSRERLSYLALHGIET